MFKLAQSPAFKNSVSLYTALSRGFAPYNKRNKVPKIMKDPKFTRQGIFKPRKRNYQYDLTQPHVIHPERYYNEAEDKKLERKEYRERRKEREGFDEIDLHKARSLEAIIGDMTADRFLIEGSSRLIMNIKEIESHYARQLDEDLTDVVANAVRALNSHIHLKNIREVGIIIQLTRKYGIWDQTIWNNAKLVLLKYFRREENETIQLLNHEVNEDNFIFMLNNILYASKRTGIDVKDLIEEVEDRFLPRVESIRNTQNLVLFINSLVSIPSFKQTTIWEKLNKLLAPKIKEMNILDVTTLLHVYSKVRVAPSFYDQLVERFVAEIGSVQNRRVEKISLVARSLGALKKRNDKFNVLAEREVEANLNDITSPIDSRFIICNFAALGIKNKKIFEHCANNVIQNKDNLSIQDLDRFFYTVLPAEVPKQLFTVLAERVQSELESNPAYFNKQKAKAIAAVLDQWKAQKKHENDSVIAKLKEHIQYSGF